MGAKLAIGWLLGLMATAKVLWYVTNALTHNDYSIPLTRYAWARDNNNNNNNTNRYFQDRFKVTMNSL